MTDTARNVIDPKVINRVAKLDVRFCQGTDPSNVVPTLSKRVPSFDGTPIDADVTIPADLVTTRLNDVLEDQAVDVARETADIVLGLWRARLDAVHALDLGHVRDRRRR